MVSEQTVCYYNHCFILCLSSLRTQTKRWDPMSSST